MAAEQALAEIADGQIVGLGTGRSAIAFITALGRRVRDERLKIRGVATSEASAEHAHRQGIPLVTLDDVATIDIAVDGADEVDPHLNLIKGRGGALLREKVVARAARRFVVLVSPEKLVPALGAHGVLPVEVIPFALAFCRRELERLGCRPVVRSDPDGGRHYRASWARACFWA
jgi:ribose 5-phosphate isomerase A